MQQDYIIVLLSIDNDRGVEGNGVKQLPGLGGRHVHTTVRTVVPIDPSAETAAPVGIVQTDSGPCDRHPVADRGLIVVSTQDGVAFFSPDLEDSSGSVAPSIG